MSEKLLPADDATVAVTANSIAATGVLVFNENGILTYGDAVARSFMPPASKAADEPVTLIDIAGLFPKLDLSQDGGIDCRIDSRWLRIGLHRTPEFATMIQLVDITDLKQSEGTLVDARDMAILADRAKSEFLANMTHELRTPLNAVIGFAEVLHDELFGPLGSPEYKDFVNDIHNSGRHLLAFIDDILDLSKIEVGHRDLKPEIMDVAGTISSAARMIERRAQAAGLTLVLEPNAELPLLNGEERCVKQIVLNLMSNAVKFTDSGGNITVTAAINSDGGLDLAVTDNGIGIEKSDQQRIFTPFVQVDTGRPAQSNGAGLGLSLVKSLADMHDADVAIDSTINVGTTITIRFPAKTLVQRANTQ